MQRAVRQGHALPKSRCFRLRSQRDVISEISLGVARRQKRVDDAGSGLIPPNGMQ